MICPRCKHGLVVRFDPRDDDPACLACGHVVYLDEPMPYVEGREAQPPSYEASIAVEENNRKANVRWRAKKRGAPPHRRGIVL